MSKEQLRRLADSYARSGVVLCLGAGVSGASGIPGWADLLRRLGALVLSNENGACTVDELIKTGFSLPAVASVLQAKWREVHGRAEDSFAELIRKALYEHLCLESNPPTSSDMAALVKRTKDSNLTLRAVAAFCTVSPRRREYAPNPRVRAIVNLNYDALLRSFMRFRYDEILLRTIDRPDARPSPDCIPVYHPHGFLHFNQKYCGDLGSETPDCLVLNEQEYFDVFSRPLSVFTYTMLFLLREHTFLFIGTSLKDDNIRRLLHYSKDERLAGFLRRGKQNAAPRADRHFIILRRNVSKTLNELTEASLQKLGVRTIWIRQHSDIPECLRFVYETQSQGGWSEVY